eukprot:TRINITY_DN65139_c0_g1_i1.p1 TRINITY_DN65139_c0_g1~~TRINITY_DN65139_c0_g1_i1.p1  ORF type:complete len:691 (+),score=96.84 TRINITY_DN65139_c0_g1_i1:76-2148(+)
MPTSAHRGDGELPPLPPDGTGGPALQRPVLRRPPAMPNAPPRRRPSRDFGDKPAVTPPGDPAPEPATAPAAASSTAAIPTATPAAVAPAAATEAAATPAAAAVSNGVHAGSTPGAAAEASECITRRGSSLYADDPELLHAFRRGRRSGSPERARAAPAITSAASLGGSTNEAEEEPRWRLVLGELAQAAGDPVLCPEVEELRVSGGAGTMHWALSDGSTGELSLSKVTSVSLAQSLALDAEDGTQMLYWLVEVRVGGGACPELPAVFFVATAEAEQAERLHGSLQSAVAAATAPPPRTTSRRPSGASGPSRGSHAPATGPRTVMVQRSTAGAPIGAVFVGTVVAEATPGKPAAIAGLEPGDCVQEVDGTAVDDFDALAAALRKAGPEVRLSLAAEKAKDIPTPPQRPAPMPGTAASVLGSPARVVRFGDEPAYRKQGEGCADCTMAGWGSQRCWVLRGALMLILWLIAFIVAMSGIEDDSCSHNLDSWLWANMFILMLLALFTMVSGKSVAKFSGLILVMTWCGERCCGAPPASGSPGAAPAQQVDPESEERDRENRQLHCCALSLTFVVGLWALVWVVVITHKLRGAGSEDCGTAYKAAAVMTGALFLAAVCICVVFFAQYTLDADDEEEADPLAYRGFSPPRGRDKWAARRPGAMVFQLPRQRRGGATAMHPHQRTPASFDFDHPGWR